MTYPPADPAEGFSLDAIPGVRVIDVADPRLDDDTRRHRLAQIKAVHKAYFGDYQHVFGEWDEGLANGWGNDTLVHLWLFLDGDEPVGEVIQHTNLRRGVVLVHFVCLDARVRATMPRDWLRGMSDGFMLCGQTDADAAGVPFWAALGEVPPEHVHKWERVGFHGLDLGYLEPHHGKHWKANGTPEFFPMTIVIRLSELGSAPPLPEVIQAGLRGYLIDYYELPESQPEVERVLQAASLVTGFDAEAPA